MKPTLKARPSHRLADRARGLAPAERAELQRQGAKAAARGDGSAKNPMDDRSNQPATTGETDGLWQERKNAWNSGHEAQIKVDDKTGEGGEFRSAKDEH